MEGEDTRVFQFPFLQRDRPLQVKVYAHDWDDLQRSTVNWSAWREGIPLVTVAALLQAAVEQEGAVSPPYLNTWYMTDLEKLRDDPFSSQRDRIFHAEGKDNQRVGIVVPPSSLQAPGLPLGEDTEKTASDLSLVLTVPSRRRIVHYQDIAHSSDGSSEEVSAWCLGCDANPLVEGEIQRIPAWVYLALLQAYHPERISPFDAVEKALLGSEQCSGTVWQNDVSHFMEALRETFSQGIQEYAPRSSPHATEQFVQFLTETQAEYYDATPHLFDLVSDARVLLGIMPPVVDFLKTEWGLHVDLFPFPASSLGGIPPGGLFLSRASRLDGISSWFEEKYLEEEDREEGEQQLSIHPLSLISDLDHVISWWNLGT